MKKTLCLQPLVEVTLNRTTAHLFCNADSIHELFPYLQRHQPTRADHAEMYRLLDPRRALSHSTSRRAFVSSGTCFVSACFIHPDEAERMGRVFIAFWRARYGFSFDGLMAVERLPTETSA